jgi:drug/metabolite transporter (DMT)-like permease
VSPTAAPRRLLVVAALLIVYVVWGSTYLGIALAIETMPPLLMAAARFLVAGAALYLVVGVRARPSRREWAAAAVTGVPLLAFGNGGVVWAQQTVDTGPAALLIASVPLWIALLDRLVFGRRLSLQAVLGLALGFFGIALLVDLDGGGGVEPAGALFLLGAAVAWAIGSLLSRGASLPQHPLLAVSMQMLCGGVVMTVMGLAAGEAGDVDPAAFSARSLGGLAYLIVFGSIVAFSAYVWLLRTTRTSVVATYAYVNPVVAVLLGWLVLDEAVTGRMLLAGGIVVAAVAMIVSAKPATARPSRALAGARAR